MRYVLLGFILLTSLFIGGCGDCFVFYIVAYRYRRYGKEVVNYYEVCHKL